MEKIRVLVVDDDSITRLGLKLSLESSPNCNVIAEASDGRQAVELASTIDSDLILMDIGLPILDGIEACRLIKNTVSSVKILMFSSHYDKSAVEGALEAGADAFCSKEIDYRRLEMIVNDTVTGQLKKKVWH